MLPYQLHKVAVGRAGELLKLHSDHVVLQALKAVGGEGNVDAVADYARTLTEHREQLVEVSSTALNLYLFKSVTVVLYAFFCICMLSDLPTAVPHLRHRAAGDHMHPR